MASCRVSERTMPRMRTLLLLWVLIVESVEYASGGGGCLGDSKLCDACSEGNNFEGCEDVVAQCEKNVCESLCLHASVACSIETSPCSGWDGCKAFDQQVNSPRTQRALCAQFKAAACGEDFSWATKCCTKDMLNVAQWAEDRTYGGLFPALPIPVESCLHDPNDKEGVDKMCKACKAAVKVKFEEGSYVWQAPTDFTEEGKQIPEKGTASMAFMNANLVPDMQTPDFANMQLKHKMFWKLFDSKSFSSKFGSAEVCTCLGCCDGPIDGKEQSCFYPITVLSDPWLK